MIDNSWLNNYYTADLGGRMVRREVEILIYELGWPQRGQFKNQQLIGCIIVLY